MRSSRGSKAFMEILKRLGPVVLPFADAATRELPLARLLRLSMFQISVGMSMVMLTGTLNRVMVVEQGVSAWIVALMVSLPLVFAPFRALLGHRSDSHRSAFGWRRVPYLWMGTLLQFAGFAIMPFALLLLADGGVGPQFVGPMAAAASFLLVGAGLHTVQTAGLALATDLAAPEQRPRVVALLYVILLLGMVASSSLFGFLLIDFSAERLIQVLQGVAVATVAINLFALWKQEAINNVRAKARHIKGIPFMEAWRSFAQGSQIRRLLVVIGLGTAGFNMQDILLEPYGGEILGMSVAATTTLTALWAMGMLMAFSLAAVLLTRGADPYRIGGVGALLGVFAFVIVVLAVPMQSVLVFRIGTGLIGFGAGLFAVSTLLAMMSFARNEQSGIAVGAWGAVQATAAGAAIAIGGALRDIVTALGNRGLLMDSLSTPASGYLVVYYLEIILLLAALIAFLPLIRQGGPRHRTEERFGMPDFPNA
ncbi:MFS transporter, BCD family, chlorophyll transporter [Ectothiorhodosinus mongolicus]|uniref:MFS transporter, BCD family, chlorophyll transporter n=1 Tax=Ectothiorhodosinus mongolicus TaxID=233100 RepID=A0A1R3W591_9GAMM|nr:BCD family MFS transporter [Ectothiorhodosinus mongolicus]ULX57584.1 MFS transporter [Ectothiorhodosinus mongolicus]SIT72937.1 MFS transporter, BCD family, chlorophyll transporter [Ectothiorhodosinus mongolicus]